MRTLYIIGLCIGFLFLSCGHKEEKNGREVSLMLDWTANVTHIPLFVGKELGYFEEEGIDISFLSSRNIEPIQALAAEKADCIITYFPRAIKAATQGLHLLIIGKLVDGPLNSVITLEETHIQTPKDCSGKVFGLAGKITRASFFDAMMKNAVDIFPEKKNVDYGMALALATKKVDAIYGTFYNIEAEEIRAMGLKPVVLHMTDFGVPSYDELVVCVKKGTPQASNDFIGRFQKALQKSILFCIKHPSKAFEIYLHANPDKREKMVEWEKMAWKKTVPLLAKKQHFSDEGIALFMKWCYAHGYLTQPLYAPSIWVFRINGSNS